jgi:4-amino-4-deoxy-L-arabinose transferase-like glycosyltransferase
MKSHHRIAVGIAVGYLLLATLYSVVVPLFEASDELWHYPMVRYLAQNSLQLPPQDPANPGPWRQQGSQPPLYYMVAALLTAGINTDDIEAVRRINPHADIGVLRADRNANMVVHRAEAEAFPWRGTTLAVHIARLFSVLLGLGTIIVSYLLGRELFPQEPLIALGAMALTAFLPMFLFISGSINNDNLSNFLGNLLTLQVVRLLKAEHPGLRQYALLGISAGCGLLAKLSIGFFIPIIALGLLLVSWRQRDWHPLVIGGLVAGGLTIVIAGWWYLRNWQLYGDPSGLAMFLQMVGRRAIPANAAQLWAERESFLWAYWGFFGGVNVTLPGRVYSLFNVVGGVALVGAVGYAVSRLVGEQQRSHAVQSNSSQRSAFWLPALITLIWPVLTFVSYLRWTAETPASQGRLIFVALSSITLWMAVGLVWLGRRRWRAIPLIGAAGFHAGVAALAPFLVIAPMYQQPTLTALPSLPPDMMIFNEPAGSGRMALLNGSLRNPGPLLPGEDVLIDLQLGLIEPMSRDWSLFVHLLTPDGVIVWQRDVYPGGGTLALSDLREPVAWENPVAVNIPLNAYAPMTVSVEVGWYDLVSGERLATTDGAETLLIGRFELASPADPEGLNLPNPIRLNFGNQIELVGYSLSDLSPAAGDTVELTLYWRALVPLTVDYKIFANILDRATLVKYAASDGMPDNWNRPTTTWQAGEIITDRHQLVVDPNAPPGIYETEIGWYQEGADGSFPRLRLVTSDGGMANDYANLTRVRVVAAGE